MSPHPQEGGHIDFGADPVGIGITWSCLHNILWNSGWILNKFPWIYYWNRTKNCSDFGERGLIFKVSAVEKLKMFCLHNILWNSGWILSKFSWIYYLEKELIRFWWPWPNFQGQSSRKAEKHPFLWKHCYQFWDNFSYFSVKTYVSEAPLMSTHNQGSVLALAKCLLISSKSKLWFPSLANSSKL